jgi:hypothetical protein
MGVSLLGLHPSRLRSFATRKSYVVASPALWQAFPNIASEVGYDEVATLTKSSAIPKS